MWPRVGDMDPAPDHVGLKPGSRCACFVAWFLLSLTCDSDSNTGCRVVCSEDAPVDAAELRVVALWVRCVPPLHVALWPLGPFLMTLNLFRSFPPSFIRAICP